MSYLKLFQFYYQKCKIGRFHYNTNIVLRNYIKWLGSLYYNDELFPT